MILKNKKTSIFILVIILLCLMNCKISFADNIYGTKVTMQMVQDTIDLLVEEQGSEYYKEAKNNKEDFINLLLDDLIYVYDELDLNQLERAQAIEILDLFWSNYFGSGKRYDGKFDDITKPEPENPSEGEGDNEGEEGEEGEESQSPAEKLKGILSEMSFPLFQEQIAMRTPNPQMQFMAIYSDVEGYGSKEEKVFTSSKKYLNEIDMNLYSKTFKSPEKLSKDYYPELYWFADGNPLIDHNMIRFMPTTGERIAGLASLDDNNARQFEFIQVDYSTTSTTAQDRLLSKTINSGTGSSFSRYDGDLVTRSGSFNNSSSKVFGYFSLKNAYESGELNVDNSLQYFATFIIPTNAAKYTGGKLYASDVNGKLFTGNLDLYPIGSSKTGMSGATETAKTTAGVKFIARIASNDNTSGEYGIFEDYSGYSGTMQKIVDCIKKNYMQASGISGISVSVGKEDSVKIEGSSLIVTVKDESARKALGNDIYNYLNKCLGKANKKDKEKLVALHSGLDLKSAYETLGVDGIFGVWMSMMIEDSYKADNVAYISASVDAGAEDLLISNSLNKVASNTKVIDRTSIDWTGESEGTYNVTAKFNNHNDSNILDGNNTIKISEASKLKPKNHETNPTTDSTKIYGELYVGRIPEAINQGLNLGNIDVLMYEQFNSVNKDGTTSMNASKFDEWSKLTNIKNSLKEEGTSDKIQSYLDSFPSAYKKSILYNLAIGKQSLGNFEIKPVAYKTANNINIVNGRISGNASMSGWTNISGSLDSILFAPGMVVKYEYWYALPYGSESTTVKYIQNRGTTYNNLEDISALELDFILIPKLNSNGTARDTKAITFDINNKNNFTKLGTGVSDGGNMKFTELIIKNKRTNSIISTYTSANTDNISLNIELPSSAFTKQDPNNPNSKYDDLVISVKVKYENFTSPTGQIVHQNKTTVGVENTFYDTAKVANINPSSKSNGFINGTEMKFNEMFTDTQYMIIPLSSVDVNSSQGKYIKLTCPEIDPRCRADNMNENDWEYINIYANKPADRDNAVMDIILAQDNNFADNTKILGENNEGQTENLMNQSLLNKTMVDSDQSLNSIGTLVKVQRLQGNILEDKYRLYLSTNMTADGQNWIEEDIQSTYIMQEGLYTGGKDKLQNSGDYIYFKFSNISEGRKIQRVNITANYRLKEDEFYDGLDNNTSNNVRQEQWGNGFNVSVSVEDGDDIDIPLGQNLTDPTNITINGEVNTYINNSDIYNMESILTTTKVYLEHEQTGKKYYPQKVDPITWGAGSSSADYMISGDSIGVSMDFGDLQLPEGGYRVWLDVKPQKYQLVEEIPWNSDYTKTDNIDFGRFNVTSNTPEGSLPTEDQVCPPGTSVTENRWNVKFRWTNKVLARPKCKNKWHKSKDGDWYECCYCKNRSGKNNNKYNWGPYGDKANYYGKGDGPYYERISSEVQIWTSSSKTWTTIRNTANVYTGETFKIRVLSKHESNRDVLPNAPYVDQMGYDTPYEQTDCNCGDIGPCEYLRRNPNYSSVSGPQRLLYTISGTSGYDRTVYRTSDQRTGGGVNRTAIWNILPEINVPHTNKKQTISVSFAVQAYKGHTSDPLHPKKQLCTSGGARVQILPSVVIEGDQEDKDQGINGNGQTGIQ